MFPNLFVLLYLAHLISDYALQTDHQAEHKAARTAAGYLAATTHAGTHALMSALALGVGSLVLGLSLSLLAATAAVLVIAGTHALIDRRWPVLWWMNATGSTGWIERGGAAHVDQTAHVTVLALCALALAA